MLRSALLAIFEGNLPVTAGWPSHKRPVIPSFDVFVVSLKKSVELSVILNVMTLIGRHSIVNFITINY